MFDLNSLVCFFVLGVIGWLIYKVHIWPYYISPMRKIPGPPSENPFYGNIKRLLNNVNEPQLRFVEEYGNIVKYHGILNRPCVLVTDTKIIQEITSSQAYDFIKPPSADLIAIGGNGLVVAEGENHKKQRKLMNPAFTHNNIKEMVPTFTRIALILKDLFEDKINMGDVNINLTHYISKATLDIIGLVGFNYEFNSLTSSSELAEAYDSLMNSPPSALRIILSILSNYTPLVRKIPVDENKRFNNACKVIERVSKRLMEEKYHEAKIDKLHGKDLLSLLININKTLPIEEKMTDDELKYQIMTFLIAGHETTSVSISWALHLLAQHPREQDFLREELVKAFPDKSNFNPTFDEINSLEYLNCVVKETLRVYTPFTASSRINIKDKFFGEYLIPKNTMILIGISALHKSTSIWGPTANNFEPKRWLDPSLIKDVSNLNFLPFLTGARSCIGNKLALTEFKVLLSMLIRNFVFQPVEGFHIKKRTFPVVKPDPHLELLISRVEA